MTSHPLRTLSAGVAVLLATASHASDEALFLGLSVTGDGVTPSAAELLSHDTALQQANLGASASARGDATYAVPLALPPTRLAPELALTYQAAEEPFGPVQQPALLLAARGRGLQPLASFLTSFVTSLRAAA